MTTSVAPARVLSNKATLIGVAVPTPTRKDGSPLPLADTPPEGFHKVKPPNTPGPGAERNATAGAAPAGETPKAERVLTQQAIDAIKAATTPSDPDKLDASTRVTRRDLPIQDGTRRSIPASAGTGGLSSSSRLLAVSAAAAALILGGRWFLLRQHMDDETPKTASAPPTGVQVVPPAADKPPAGPAAAPSAAPTATAAEAPEPAASAVPDASARPPGTRVVVVKISPAGAKLYRKGKSVGTSPVTVELKPDEKKRSFEVGMPGYVTRRLVVDGSKPEIFIGLKPAGR